MAKWMLVLLVAWSVAWPGALGANEGGSAGPDITARDPAYGQAAKLVKQNRFAEAIPLLRKVIGQNGRDADAYNLLGYSQRKLGDLDAALAAYREALRIDPSHRGANEYIGEAYLLLGRIELAKKHLAVLDKECWLGCQEFTELKEAIAKYEATHRS